MTTSQVTFHASGRNMTISIPAHDILIRFRFTGHHRVKENFHGISTFTEPLWLADYRYVVIVKLEHVSANNNNI